jgi:hypothetical protein
LARDNLRASPTNRNFPNEPKIENYDELFPDNFHVINNFTEVMAGDMHPLSPLRHERVYLTMHAGKDDKHRFCIVSEFEANAMKGQSNNENTIRFSLGGTLLKGVRNGLRPSMLKGNISTIGFIFGTVTSRGYNRRKMNVLPRTWSGASQANQGSVAIMKSAASAGWFPALTIETRQMAPQRLIL